MKLPLRASQFLTDHHIAFETVIHPPAYTAQKLAKSLRVSGRIVAKTVLLAGPAGYYLAVLPATHVVDLPSVEKAIGVPVRLALEDEIAELFNDCERGTLCPFGHLYGLSTLLDDSFTAASPMVFEVQRHTVAIRMRCQDFERLEHPRRLSLSRPVQAAIVKKSDPQRN